LVQGNSGAEGFVDQTPNWKEEVSVALEKVKKYLPQNQAAKKGTCQ